MIKRGIFFLLLVCLLVSPCCAGQVTILTEQKDYYFFAGNDVALPLILNNSYGHDVAGVLRVTTTTERSPGNATTRVQEKSFTLFAGQRSYLLPIGRQDTPITFHDDIVFLYDDNGGRRASLEDIVIHFVKSPDEILVNQNPQESTDSPDPEAGASGRIAGSDTTPPSTDPFQRLQNNQVAQDPGELKQQLQKEDSASLRQKKEFLSSLMRDPTINAINRTLVNDGFELAVPDVVPVTKTSGNFSFSYQKKSQSAVVQGSVDQGRFLFADESSESSIPVPDLLRDNETFRTYESELANSGFGRNATRMQYTPGKVSVTLAYGDPKGRVTHINAAITNGTVSGIERETISEPSPFLIPALSVMLICLLSGGVVVLSRRIRPSTLPAVENTGPGETGSDYQNVAEYMLDEAGVMATHGNYPGAYARAGQALRFVLSLRVGDGRELTNEELVRMLSPGDTERDHIEKALDRCSMVAFAKDVPDPEEFAGILGGIRDLLSKNR